MQLNLPSTLWKPEKLDKIEIFLKKENLFEAPEGYQGSEELRIKIDLVHWSESHYLPPALA